MPSGMRGGNNRTKCHENQIYPTRGSCRAPGARLVRCAARQTRHRFQRAAQTSQVRGSLRQTRGRLHLYSALHQQLQARSLSLLRQWAVPEKGCRRDETQTACSEADGLCAKARTEAGVRAQARAGRRVSAQARVATPGGMPAQTGSGSRPHDSDHQEMRAAAQFERPRLPVTSVPSPNQPQEAGFPF